MKIIVRNFECVLSGGSSSFKIKLDTVGKIQLQDILVWNVIP